MPSSIMSCPSVHTRPWVTRLWTAACITGRDSEEQGCFTVPGEPHPYSAFERFRVPLPADRRPSGSNGANRLCWDYFRLARDPGTIPRVTSIRDKTTVPLEAGVGIEMI